MIKTSNLHHYSVLRKAELIADKTLALLAQPAYQELKLSDLHHKIPSLKAQIIPDVKQQSEEVICAVFAIGYKAIELVYGIKLHKVQIMGAYALYIGDVAEMKTGEGKTITAILPSLLAVLEEKGVFIVTVNEYLSQRDAFNVSKVFNQLGITVGSVLASQDGKTKKENYLKDIVYLKNSELGFDYLRDNMVRSLSQKIQVKKYDFAIVDEVDSILIDEARTPLIIAGGAEVVDDSYALADTFVKSLTTNDYKIDHETKQAFLTEVGVIKAETYYQLNNLYLFENSKTVHRIHNALQANFIFHYGVDYTIVDDEIVLIDIFTGRLLEGRQFSEGLNQAIESKEQVTIKPETKTYASVTYQNLFRMFKRISGMSGTALPEAEEFNNVYNMRVLQIPTDLPIIRKDYTDLIYASKEAKMQSVIKKIVSVNSTGQPILVGTKSVNDSEFLSQELTKLNLSHEVLNAKNNSREAEIVSLAGQKGAITISTNMAGRGTDIKLGEGVVELGGLFVLGTERYEARRIDDQLRGRSGRQGDPGESQFFVSLEDDIMLRAGLKRIKKFMSSLDKNPIPSKTIQKAITISQKRMEGINYDSRKSVIEYDDVLNRQRQIVYQQRDEILSSKSCFKLFKNYLAIFIDRNLDSKNAYENNQFSNQKIIQWLNEFINLELKVNEYLEKNKEELRIILKDLIIKHFEEKFQEFEMNQLNNFIRNNLLMIIDYNFQVYLDDISRLRTGIIYRQYAQKNPVQAFVHESSALFEELKLKIIDGSITIILNSNTERPKEEFFVTKPRKTKLFEIS